MEKRIKTCDGCGQEKVIVVGFSTRNKAFCRDCAPKKERKPIKRSSPTQGKKRVRISQKPSPSRKLAIDRDWEIGREIWAERPHVCAETGETLPEPLRKIYLSHLMSKGAHPELRHEKRNIVLHSPMAHNEWEFGDRKQMKTYEDNIEWMQANGYVLHE